MEAFYESYICTTKPYIVKARHRAGRIRDRIRKGHIMDTPSWSNGKRCETCGAWCIDNCVVCGAPQCCPQCCKITIRDAHIDAIQKGRQQLIEATKQLLWKLSHNTSPSGNGGDCRPGTVDRNDATIRILGQALNFAETICQA